MRIAAALFLCYALGMAIGWNFGAAKESKRADQWRAVADSLCINAPPGGLAEFHRRCYQIDGEIR